MAFLYVCVLLSVSACSTNVVVEGRLPTPLVKQIPANVAVYYDETFKSFVHSESLRGEGDWKIDLGKQNLAFFRNLMDAMFVSATEVSSEDLSVEDMAKYDAIVVPTIEKYGFLTPRISGLKFFSASLNYKITILRVDGETVLNYPVVGYGKSEPSVFGAGKALMEATMSAIRDGGTRIATELVERPKFVNWLASLESES